MSSAKWRPFGLGLNVLRAFDSNGLPPPVHTLLVAPVYLRVSSYFLCISCYNMEQNRINYDTLTQSSMLNYACQFSYYFSKNKNDMQLKDIHVYKLVPWLFVFITLLSIWASFPMIPKSLHNAFFWYSTRWCHMHSTVISMGGSGLAMQGTSASAATV